MILVRGPGGLGSDPAVVAPFKASTRNPTQHSFRHGHNAPRQRRPKLPIKGASFHVFVVA